MAGFKFNFSSFGKPKVKKTSCDRNRKLVERNIMGVIGINLDAAYYVQVGEIQYSLTLESYDLKGKNVYYCKELQNNKILEVISLTKQKRNQRKYLPFGVGCVVKGNIYNIFGKHRFNITKVIEFKELSQEDYNKFISISHNCKEFFRNNYEEIKQCMN